jgi:Tfp pilus assembly protein PilO
MREDDILPEEREQSLRQKKMLKKTINKVLSDYFGFLIAGVVVVILAFGFFFLLKPKYDQTMQIISVINKQEEADFENKKRELQKIKDLLKSYNDIDENYRKKVFSIIPERENKEEIFSEVNYLVSRNGLILQSVALSEGGGGYDISDGVSGGGEDYLASGEIKKVTISFSIRGTDYESFKNFISAIESNLPILDIVNLNFDPGNNASSYLIDTYYLQAPKKES